MLAYCPVCYYPMYCGCGLCSDESTPHGEKRGIHKDGFVTCANCGFTKPFNFWVERKNKIENPFYKINIRVSVVSLSSGLFSVHLLYDGLDFTIGYPISPDFKTKEEAFEFMKRHFHIMFNTFIDDIIEDFGVK